MCGCVPCAQHVHSNQKHKKETIFSFIEVKGTNKGMAPKTNSYLTMWVMGPIGRISMAMGSTISNINIPNVIYQYDNQAGTI